MEANFVVDSVAENLKCVVCHFVLKDPVLIIDCGHRLCKVCFESVRGYAVQHSNPLLCPHDRENINIDKVVDDIGVARMVMDLQVFCNNKPEGCFWSGELRQLENHVNKQCNVTSLKKFVGMVETRLNQKDLEMQELQARVSSRDKEMLELRTMMSSKDGEVERIISESGKKFDEIRERLRVVEENMGEKEEELALLRYEMAGLRVTLARKSKDADSSAEPKRRKTRSKIIDDEKENQHICDVDMGDSSDGGESFKKIDQGFSEMDKRIALLDFRLASVSKEISQNQAQLKGVDEAKEKTNEEVEVTSNPSYQGGSSSSVDSVALADCGANCAHCAEIKTLKERVMNVHSYIPNEGTVFLWKIRNYSYYEDLGNRIDSPQFYSDISGHCCNLNLRWEPDGSLGLFINIHVGVGEPDEPFVKKVRFSSMDKYGKMTFKTLKKERVIQHSNAFIINPGKQSSCGRGFSPFLKNASLKDHVIDDVLTIKCEVTNN